MVGAGHQKGKAGITHHLYPARNSFPHISPSAYKSEKLHGGRLGVSN